MRINQAMELLKAEGSDYLCFQQFSGHISATILKPLEHGTDDIAWVGHGDTPQEAFDDAISKIHKPLTGDKV